jgi:hypothetical protein
MAFNTNDLQMPLSLGQGISRYLNELIRTPTNFGPTQRAFSGMMSNPSLQLGPNGQFMDPNQNQAALQTANLGQRGQVASQDLQNKQQDASLLLSAGNTTAQLGNEIPFLNAQNIGSSSPFGGFLGNL